MKDNQELGEVKVGRLATASQIDYPGLGDWWVQLWIEVGDKVLARVYGDTPEEARNKAELIANYLNSCPTLIATIESAYSGDPDTKGEKYIKPLDRGVINTLPIGTKLYCKSNMN